MQGTHNISQFASRNEFFFTKASSKTMSSRTPQTCKQCILPSKMHFSLTCKEHTKSQNVHFASRNAFFTKASSKTMTQGHHKHAKNTFCLVKCSFRLHARNAQNLKNVLCLAKCVFYNSKFQNHELKDTTNMQQMHFAS